MIEAKICGLKRVEEIEAAARAGASHVGFVFFEPSPRHLSYDAAKPLVDATPEHVKSTALFVKQSPEDVLAQADALGLDAIQLHGSYSVEQVAFIRDRSDAQILMAFSIGEAEDFDKVAPFAAVVDRALYDAKPPKGSDRPGGNAVSFDWTLLTDRKHPAPWMLAGGLNPTNVTAAVRATNAPGVDVSSGVESARGVKSVELITEFLTSVAAA